MAEITKVQMTSSEYLELPETTTPMHLIDGELIVSPSPEVLHQDRVFVVGKFLDRIIPNGKIRLSPIDVKLDEMNTVQPDVLWMAEGGTCHLSTNKKHLVGAPELIVEVLSPGTAKLDRGMKFDLYQKHGVKEYWILDPHEQFVEVYSRNGEKLERIGAFGADETFHSLLLSKDIELRELFAD